VASIIEAETKILSLVFNCKLKLQKTFIFSISGVFFCRRLIIS